MVAGRHMINSSRCLVCGGRLRNAVFCPLCGSSLCSLACYLEHLTGHDRLSGHPFRARAPAPLRSRRQEPGLFE